MPKPLTPKQKRIVTFIRQFQLSHGYSPTMQELGDALGVSKVTIHEHIASLVEKGVILRSHYKARSLELAPDLDLPNETRNTRLPLVGTIAAGSPIAAIQDTEHLDLEEVFAPQPGGSKRFVLKVRGDSMIEDQIADGDYVICEQRSAARNGEIVVALTGDGDATLKRYFKEGDKIRLQPANSTMQPMIYPAGQIQVQGVCVGVVRAY